MVTTSVIGSKATTGSVISQPSPASSPSIRHSRNQCRALTQVAFLTSRHEICHVVTSSSCDRLYMINVQDGILLCATTTIPALEPVPLQNREPNLTPANKKALADML